MVGEVLMGLIKELHRMLSFYRRHRHCEGLRDVKAMEAYMLWCPVHEVGETTGDVWNLMADYTTSTELGTNKSSRHRP
jgi:hypothetical protein